MRQYFSEPFEVDVELLSTILQRSAKNRVLVSNNGTLDLK